MSAITKLTIPARIVTTPIIAGQPCTDPLNVTAHWSMGYPALMPALPFHFDHNEIRPITTSTAEDQKSLRERMHGILNLGRLIANTCNCSYRPLKVNYIVT